MVEKTFSAKKGGGGGAKAGNPGILQAQRRFCSAGEGNKEADSGMAIWDQGKIKSSGTPPARDCVVKRLKTDGRAGVSQKGGRNVSRDATGRNTRALKRESWASWEEQGTWRWGPVERGKEKKTEVNDTLQTYKQGGGAQEGRDANGGTTRSQEETRKTKAYQ